MGLVTTSCMNYTDHQVEVHLRRSNAWRHNDRQRQSYWDGYLWGYENKGQPAAPGHPKWTYLHYDFFVVGYADGVADRATMREDASTSQVDSTDQE